MHRKSEVYSGAISLISERLANSSQASFYHGCMLKMWTINTLNRKTWSVRCLSLSARTLKLGHGRQGKFLLQWQAAWTCYQTQTREDTSWKYSKWWEWHTLFKLYQLVIPRSFNMEPRNVALNFTPHFPSCPWKKAKWNISPQFFQLFHQPTT